MHSMYSAFKVEVSPFRMPSPHGNHSCVFQRPWHSLPLLGRGEGCAKTWEVRVHKSMA